MKSEESESPGMTKSPTQSSNLQSRFKLPGTIKSPSPSTSLQQRFNTTPRTDAEIFAASRRIPQESRPTDAAALAKLRARATIGIDPQFTLLDLDNVDETLQHTYNVSMRILSLEYILTQYDMIDAFNIHLFQLRSHPLQLLEDINGGRMKVKLLPHHSSLTEDQVQHFPQMVWEEL